MTTPLLFAAFVLGIIVAVVAFVFNSYTPLQLGPVPFFGGVGLALVCLIMILARLAVRL